jgi:hypothetical protein
MSRLPPKGIRTIASMDSDLSETSDRASDRKGTCLLEFSAQPAIILITFLEVVLVFSSLGTGVQPFVVENRAVCCLVNLVLSFPRCIKFMAVE